MRLDEWLLGAYMAHGGAVVEEFGPSAWMEIGRVLLGSWRMRELESEVEPLDGGLARAVELAALTQLVSAAVPSAARSADGRWWYAMLCLDPDCKKRPIPRVEEHLLVALSRAELRRAAREFRAAAEILASAVGAGGKGRTWQEELHLTMLDAEALGKRLARLGRAASGESARSVAELAVRAAHLAEGLETVAEGD